MALIIIILQDYGGLGPKELLRLNQETAKSDEKARGVQNCDMWKEKALTNFFRM